MREPRTEFAAAGAATALPLWRTAMSPRVRDLAWCTMAPPLLHRLPPLNALSTGGNPVALAQWPPAALAAWQRWLSQADPARLPPTIEELAASPAARSAPAPFPNDGRTGSPNASLRLGRHAERLLQFALEHGEGIELVAVNLPIRRQHAHGVHTLGELDFVWRESGPARDAGALVHWEMATKFYLLAAPDHGAGDASSSVTLHAFVGPNLVDRLGDKLSHILRRQLPLSCSAEARALLGAPVARSEVVLLGWLFYQDGCVPAGLEALGLNPAHLRGWWSTLQSWRQRASSPGETPVRWHRLPRSRWLSPAMVPEGETESFDALYRALADRFAEPHQDLSWRREAPVMVCELEPAGVPGWWRERSRGFVVPPGWTERARSRAAEPPR